MPEIAFIMGKSASGKDKIYKNLIEDESLKLNTVILYTTRPMRAGETDGVEYFFEMMRQLLRCRRAAGLLN